MSRKDTVASAASPTSPRDWVTGLVFFAATVAYLAALPHSIGWGDESYFLYESKRLADGEVLYRDVFQFLTPVASYVMAALFYVFGATIVTARLSTAVIHGLTLLTLWFICRALGARRSLAVLPAAAYLAISQPAWPFASWHWFGTCETALLLLALSRTTTWQRPATMLLPGLVSGLLIATQQQKGVVMAIAVAGIVVVDHLLRWRCGMQPRARTLLAQLIALAAGTLLVAGGVLLIALAQAGFPAMVEALVRFPLQSYPARTRSSWGFVGPMSAQWGLSTFPVVLKYLPLVVIPQALAVLYALVGGRMGREVRPALVVLVMGIASALSILYAPDYIHIAFIAPPFYVGCAQWLEWGAATLPPRWSRVCGGVVATAVIAATTFHLYGNAIRAQREHPFSHATAFGRIDFEHRWQTILIDTVRALLDQVPSRTLFCYPSFSAPYLLAAGTNPTPYQFLLAGLSPPGQTERVLQILATRDVPYILYLPVFVRKDDPIRRVIDEQYHFVDIPALAGVRPGANVWLFQRNDVAPQTPQPQAP